MNINKKVILGAFLAGSIMVNSLSFASSPFFGGQGAVTSVTPGVGASALGKAEDAAHASADVGVEILCVAKATPTINGASAGDYATPLCDSTTGAVYTQPVGTSATSLGKAEDAAHTTADTGVNILFVRDDTPAATGADGDYVEPMANSDGALLVAPYGTGAANYGKAEDAAHTTADVGVASLMVVETTTGGTSATDGDYAFPTLNADGAQRVQIVPNTTGGLSIFRNIDVDETPTGQAAKETAGMLYSVTITNDTAATKEYVKIYDATVAGTTVGTTTPVITIPTYGVSTITVSWPEGLQFANGITFAATTALADNDTGAPAANAVIINASYK